MPKVSVILPVYNAEKYLKQAIDSVLLQAFNDFELILINDGSTDDSETIILGYKNQQIRYIKNEKNNGLIYSLNKAVAEAQGEYLARMDADDICFPERLELQSQWLNEHPGTAIVGSFNIIIDESGAEMGYSEKDRDFVSAAQIRKRMPVENCLTHPSVMGRAEVFKAYPYSSSQKNIEDYDLWLRLLADGYVIEKIAKPLLYYRVHQTSVTQSKLRKTNFFLKHFRCKQRYLAARMKSGKFNAFDLRVAKEAMLDLGRAAGKGAKKFLTRK
ncbi:glycosyltransferase family 2 protein [Flavisolibacter ginsenosidimutans]|uniref:Glycosyltransferase n=1 Tax=Flavisolibacter ginsenosidimutans TaxID=661481 RepID=A0A5B8UEI8_9BACT|nr:glycosyltransferase [Flavisolibacter ginsenosidimutans]QEC55077.1 glycosyltransferase [Flavisolibacter ginsenosidimutans]